MVNKQGKRVGIRGGFASLPEGKINADKKSKLVLCVVHRKVKYYVAVDITKLNYLQNVCNKTIKVKGFCLVIS